MVSRIWLRFGFRFQLPFRVSSFRERAVRESRINLNVTSWSDHTLTFEVVRQV